MRHVQICPSSQRRPFSRFGLLSIGFLADATTRRGECSIRSWPPCARAGLGCLMTFVDSHTAAGRLR